MDDNQKKIRIWPGSPYPMGAYWDGQGVNFSIFSENAKKVELCLFESESSKEFIRINLSETTNKNWHCFLPDIKPGQIYGYRIYGIYDPINGYRFNHNKIILDPYAKAICRKLIWRDEFFGYKIGDNNEDLSFDERDNAEFAPLAVVIDNNFDWKDDKHPKISWNETIIYELHVKGFTKLHPELPEAERGTYAGLASEPVIKYFKDLGITSVELLPVQYHLDDRHLIEKGLSNYWGYNPLSFFAPEARYCSTPVPLDCVSEFKKMVYTLHKAGIEVILDVVFNHTGEGNQLGPTLSFRGVDNSSYYRLLDDNHRYYEDFTGCGNTLNMRHPKVIQLIMDSLRYWVLEMHVDGFRFDLASALARELFEVDKLSAFFDVINQDPVISQVKLIAEPWDLGEGGYQVGNFPPGWTEWNGKYRDTIRRYWKGEGGMMGEFATRLSGSSDLYESDGRRPFASINFITCHDGFTLEDLVSYNQKHNELNLENNTDGTNDNHSWNSGVEGPSDDVNILEFRERQKRNLLSTLVLSQGVPMLSAGDEIGFSHNGNNNSYCQDNEINWLDWNLTKTKEDLLAFTQKILRLRKQRWVFRRRKFFQGRSLRGNNVKDITWLSTDGKEMSDDMWDSTSVMCLGVRLAGDAISEVDEYGDPIQEDSVLLLMNASDKEEKFILPETGMGFTWDLFLNTFTSEKQIERLNQGSEYVMKNHTFAVFIQVEQQTKE